MIMLVTTTMTTTTKMMTTKPATKKMSTTKTSTTKATTTKTTPKKMTWTGKEFFCCCFFVAPDDSEKKGKETNWLSPRHGNYQCCYQGSEKYKLAPSNKEYQAKQLQNTVNLKEKKNLKRRQKRRKLVLKSFSYSHIFSPAAIFCSCSHILLLQLHHGSCSHFLAPVVMNWLFQLHIGSCCQPLCSCSYIFSLEATSISNLNFVYCSALSVLD